MTIKAVWTDFGGVLTPPVATTLTAFCEKTGLDPGALMQATLKVTASYGTDDIMLPLDTPLVTEQEWLRQVGDILLAEHGITAQVTSLADAWFGDRETNTAWLERLRELKSIGLFVGMLSNMPPAWDAHWRRMVDPDGLFDEVVLSFQVGYRKPAKEIFDIAATRAGVAPQECVFVDDLEKNVAAAAAAGWHAIRFTETADAIVELDRALGGSALVNGTAMTSTP